MKRLVTKLLLQKVPVPFQDAVFWSPLYFPFQELPKYVSREHFGAGSHERFFFTKTSRPVCPRPTMDAKGIQNGTNVTFGNFNKTNIPQIVAWVNAESEHSTPSHTSLTQRPSVGEHKAPGDIPRLTPASRLKKGYENKYTPIPTILARNLCPYRGQKNTQVE